MDKIKMHKFIEMSIPIRACNLRCEYCYVTQNNWWSSQKVDFKVCLDKIAKAFAQERLGGVCMFNLCATGETLLQNEVIEIIKVLLGNGHFVMVVTNGTLSERFEKCCLFPSDLRKRLFFKISFHYLELKKRKLLEVFFTNIKLLHEAGISFSVELTPDDSYIPYIEDIKNVCHKYLGCLCHVTVPRNECIKGYPLMTSLSRTEFKKLWMGFDSSLFEFKESIFEIRRKEFCYAGKWSFVVDVITGEYKQCYRGKVLGNLYKSIHDPIKELAVGHNCAEGHCFNGHAFLGFGVIPEIITPSFAEMRNRTLPNGEMWLNKEMKMMMECKLVEDNEVLSQIEKIICTIKSFDVKKKIKAIIR